MEEPNKEQQKRKGRGSNLTPELRKLGGDRSARMQKRDNRGRFAGKVQNDQYERTRESQRDVAGRITTTQDRTPEETIY